MSSLQAPDAWFPPQERALLRSEPARVQGAASLTVEESAGSWDLHSMEALPLARKPAAPRLVAELAAALIPPAVAAGPAVMEPPVQQQAAVPPAAPQPCRASESVTRVSHDRRKLRTATGREPPHNRRASSLSRIEKRPGSKSGEKSHCFTFATSIPGRVSSTYWLRTDLNG